jgi:hypothetical protein
MGIFGSYGIDVSVGEFGRRERHELRGKRSR